jgi:hypothetical protein
MRRSLMTAFTIVTLGIAAVLVAPAASQADVIITTASTADNNFFPVSNSDLFQTNLGSIATTGTFSYFSANTPALLADGAFGGRYDGDATVAPEGGATVTFILDVSVNTAGYTLTQFDSFASWDAGRDGQEYTVAYSTVSAPAAFLDLVTIPQLNGDPTGGGYWNTKVSLTDGSGALATHVAAIRYTFTSFENNGTAYREIDAFGLAPSAVVPEPASLLMVGSGLIGLLGLGKLRKKARAA